MKLKHYLSTLIFGLLISGVYAQLEDLPQSFSYKDKDYWNLYYPVPHGNWYPKDLDQADDAKKRFLYLGPIGVRGIAHDPSLMQYASNRAITNPALRNSNGVIDLSYYEVLGVTPGGPASPYLLPGDLIVKANGKDLVGGGYYNPSNKYDTKSLRVLFECLGDAIDKAEGTGSLNLSVLRIPEGATEKIPEQWTELHRTNVLTAKTEKFIEVDLSAGDFIQLIAEDAGDGNGGDHAYWLDARWVQPDGTEIYITNNEWLSALVGWGSITWGNEISFSGGTTTRSIFAHAPSKVSFLVPDGVSKLRVTLKNNNYGGTIVGVVKKKSSVVNYGDLSKYLINVTIPIKRIGSFLAGGAERQHKIDQIITSQAAWLLGEQREDGGFESWGSYTTDAWDTAYIGLAMLAADEPRFTESARKAAYYIANLSDTSNWCSPKGIVLTFLCEYYLRTKDAGILPGIQKAVEDVEKSFFQQGYAGHGYGNYGYGTGGQNSGFSYLAMGLAMASRTPVELDSDVLDKVLTRMDAMAPSGVIGYGRTTKKDFFDAHKSARDHVSLTGPCVVANCITGQSQRFFDLSKLAYERAVGALDFGHSTQSFGLFGGTIGAANLGDELLQRHLETVMPKMVLQRNYQGGVVVSECRFEFMGAEGMFRPRMATAVQILTLAANRKNLAITGKRDLRASVMKPGMNTHVWDLETHRFYLRGWATAIELLGSNAPASLKSGYVSLREIDYNGPIHILHDRIFAILESDALNVVEDINALSGVSDELKAQAIEMVLGIDLNISVTEKEADAVEIKLSAYWPLRERNRWNDSATTTSWKANADYKMVGSISIAKGTKLSDDVNITFDSSSANSNWKEGYANNLGSVNVNRLDSTVEFTLPVQITYTVGTHSISYTRNVTFEEGVGGNFDDARYVTIPSSSVMRVGLGDELVVRLPLTGEYLQMHGEVGRQNYQGEKVKVDFRQGSLGLGACRNVSVVQSDLKWFRASSITAAPGSSLDQSDIDALIDSDETTTGRSRAKTSTQAWVGFEMDLGALKDINGIKIVEKNKWWINSNFKVEVEVAGKWQQVVAGDKPHEIDYFKTVRTQKIRVFFSNNGGSSIKINDVQFLNNPAGGDGFALAHSLKTGAYERGVLWQEQYDGLSSGTIASLKNNVAYPTSPSSSKALYTMESDSNLGDLYGLRWTGWITPDETGDYVFYAAADEQVEMYLSSDENPANKVLIASKLSSTLSRQWSSAATSSPISLKAGKRYYVELLMAEQAGDDHCAVAWKKPSDNAIPADGSTPISDYYFSTIVGGVSPSTDYVFPEIVSQPSSIQATEGQSVSLNVVADGLGSLTYQWMKDGIPLYGAESATLNISTASSSDVGFYQCLVKNKYGQVLSDKVEISFANHPPELGDQALEVAGSEPSGTVLGTVVASDIDINDVLSFSIIGGNESGKFAIDSNSGVVTTQSVLNEQECDFYMLEVEVSDNGTPSLSARAYLRINVLSSDPRLRDMDSDGYSDQFEIDRGSDPKNSQSVPNTLLAAYWDFNDALASGESIDLVGAVPGQMNASAVFTSDGGGRSGQAGDYAIDFGLTSNGQRMDIDNVDWLNAATADDQLTISYWIKVSSVGSSSAFWALSQSSPAGNRGIQSHCPWSNRNIYFDMGGDSASNRVFADGSSVSWSEWNHIALVKNGSVAEIWVNGVKLKSTTGMPALKTDIYHLVLGADGRNGNSLMGQMDEFAVFKTALNEVQISALAAGNKPTSIDVNKPPVFALDPFVKSIATEDVLYSDSIASDASDTDGDSLSYSKVSGPDWLSVSSDGTLSGTPVNSDVGLNVFTVQVDDGKGHIVNATMKVIVKNVNHTSVSVSENASVGTTVATVVASGVDADDTLSYSITSENASEDTSGTFSIDDNGNIITAKALDFEKTVRYVLTVTVTDSTGLANTSVITINVSDVVAGDDSDGDGLNDNWEITFYDSTDSVSASSDEDHDGLNAFQEMVFGGNPAVPDSSVQSVQSRIIDDAISPKFELKFRRPKNYATLGVIYTIQQGTDMINSNWVDYTQVTPTVVDDGNNPKNEWVIYKLPMPVGNRVFYRCHVFYSSNAE